MTAPTAKTTESTAAFWGPARGIAVAGAGAVLALGAWGWGRPGLAAAAAGAALSLVNVWALARFATGAVALVPVLGPRAAAAKLTSALGAKTVVLLTLIWVLTRSGGLETVPFALGLMVSVVSLLGAGAAVALRAEK